MPRQSPSRAAVFTTVFLVVVLSLGWALRDRYFITPTLEEGDTAVNAVQIENAKHLRELYGNYSRFEFNHPGPAFFYLYAFGEVVFHDWAELTPSPGNAHLLTSMLVQAFFFSLGIAILSSHLRSPAWPALAALATALYLAPMHEPFTSIWPPHVLLMPFFCFLAACASTAAIRFADAVPMVVAGSFLFHGHVAQSMFVGALGGSAGLIGWLRIRRGAEGTAAQVECRRVIGTCAAIAALFLLPLVLDVMLYREQGNVAGILGLYYANFDDRKSLGQAVHYFLSFATRTTSQAELLSDPGPHTVAFFRDHTPTIAVSLAMLAAVPLWAWICRRRKRPDDARVFGAAAAFLWAAVGLSVFWARSQIGGIEHFNGYFFYAIYTFALVLVAAIAADLVPDRLLRPIVVLAVLGAFAGFAYHNRLPAPREQNYDRIRNAIAEASRTDQRPKFLVFEHATWPVAASVAIELERRKLGFYVADWWGFMFGSRHEEARLAGAAEKLTDIWWLTRPGEGGLPLTPELSLFSEPAPVSPAGGAIRFTPGGNGFRHVVSGVTVGNVDAAVTNLPRVLLLLAPEPAAGDVEIRFEAEDLTKSQAGEVRFNGELVGRIQPGERGEVGVTVPRALWNQAATATLELRFPDAKSRRMYKRPRYDWWTAWHLWQIRFEARSP